MLLVLGKLMFEQCIALSRPNAYSQTVYNPTAQNKLGSVVGTINVAIVDVAAVVVGAVVGNSSK